MMKKSSKTADNDRSIELDGCLQSLGRASFGQHEQADMQWNDLLDSSLNLSCDGSSSVRSVAILNSNVTIEFFNVAITLSIQSSPSAVTIVSSTIQLVMASSNAFHSSSHETSGIECSSGSNITLQQASLGSLSASGSSMAAGIGLRRTNLCSSVTITNGSASATVLSGPGIGSGDGSS
jgi:hypothetical protein